MDHSWCIFLLLYFIYVNALLCYNGTLTYKQYGEDPLQSKLYFIRSNKYISRLRCSFTTSCGVVYCINNAKSLLCYNCSATHRDKEPCAGDFVSPFLYFNSTRKLLRNCTQEKSMCFVRSWSARAKHMWIIQRGCYQLTSEDLLPQEMSIPTRAMTCKHQRLADAEYKVCLCQADWCNGTAPLRIVYRAKNIMWTWTCVLPVGILIRCYI